LSKVKGAGWTELRRRRELLAVPSPLRGARTIRHPACLCYALGKMDEKNRLYFGDNLKILREYVPDASVDLIYLDPPFNSSATYNVLFKEKSGEESAAQIMAFECEQESS
jgi:16S rRNA G966 N2-methylase RsmD